MCHFCYHFRQLLNGYTFFRSSKYSLHSNLLVEFLNCLITCMKTESLLSAIFNSELDLKPNMCNKTYLSKNKRYCYKLCFSLIYQKGKRLTEPRVAVRVCAKLDCSEVNSVLALRRSKEHLSLLAINYIVQLPHFSNLALK
jgi:hypothetical protein